jgi:glucose/mannose transport system substrate-binding protein
MHRRRSRPEAAITAARLIGARALLALVLGGIACQSGVPDGRDERSGAGAAPAAAERRDLVEIFSWWAEAGEFDALQALIAVHATRQPKSRIFNSAAASRDKGRDQLEDLLAGDESPDIFQEYVHARRAVTSQSALRRRPLDDLVDELGLRQVIFPEILHDITRDGHVFVMPVNVHRENTLLYNRRLFAQHHLAIPRTLDELLATCRRFKAAGVVPIATSDAGWILRIMFNDLAVAKLGAAPYRDYFTGQRPLDAAALRGVIDVFAEILENYVNPDAGDAHFDWINAAQTMLNGDAAMFLHGDWAKGYIAAIGGNTESDFGAVSAPGTSEMFLYGIDAFALASGARNAQGAREFLATVASPEGQAAFNRWKGSSPIRPDVPREKLDQIGRETLSDLEHARVRMMVRTRPEWEEALAAFAHDHDRDKLLRAFVEKPPGA